MEQNVPIYIKQVGNGFIITCEIDRNCTVCDEDINVFRSMADMCEFIHEHFTHRNINCVNDVAIETPIEQYVEENQE